MEKLTIEQLAIYIGHEYRFHVPTQDQAADFRTEELGGIIIAIDYEKKCIRLDSRSELFLWNKKCWQPDIKGLILRPLSDMTGEETKIVSEKWTTEQLPLNNKGMCIPASLTMYLIKQGFDLFGWIESGLAIDRTNLVYDKTIRENPHSHLLK